MIVQTLGFCHMVGGTEKFFRLIEVKIHHTVLAAGIFSDITAEPYRGTVLHLCDCGFL